VVIFTTFAFLFSPNFGFFPFKIIYLRPLRNKNSFKINTSGILSDMAQLSLFNYHLRKYD